MASRGKKSVLLLSGGLDSAANLALCRELDDPILAITADYGQKAAQREIDAATRLCRHYDIWHEAVDLRWLGKLGGNALTKSETRVPEPSRQDLDDHQASLGTAKAVWVPNRNGVLINVAAAFAERLSAEQVVVGFNIEEAQTFPDNTVDFMAKAGESLRFSTANRVSVFSYTATWDKKRIVAELRSLREPFPFDLLWSCYRGEEHPCGKCESCQRLQRALEHAEKAPVSRS